MSGFKKHLSVILVFAMMISLCSCAFKTEAQKSEEASQSEADKFSEVYDLMYGCIGADFSDAIGRLESYFGIGFDLRTYVDCVYFDDTEGYYDYRFEKKIRIAELDFNQIRIRCTMDETVFHVGFISDEAPAEKLDADYGHIVALSTKRVGEPKTVRNTLNEEDVAFTEYGLGNRIVLSAGRFKSSEYNSLWFDINDWKVTEELGIT